MNKKRCVSFASIMALGLSLLLISGCGSSNRDGDATTVSNVSNTACVTCHSASIEPLSGDSIVANYTASVHNLHSIGCQDCHGAGGSHNGIGPIPYPRPNYVQCADCHNNGVAISAAGVTSNISTVFLATNYQLVTAYSNSKHLGIALEPDAPCNRCHTHQGAVLSVVSHFTGDGTVMAAGVGAPGAITDAEPIKCDTCHVTHRTDKLRVDSAWDPSTTVGSVTSSLASPLNDQFRLCTQCHGYTNPAGLLMGSGTVASGTALVGHHETSWYRIIGTTHFNNLDNPTNGITGYVIRIPKTAGAYASTTNPNARTCFDCHGHEAKTNTQNSNPGDIAKYDATKATIYTDWAQSSHAGGLLAAKVAAAGSAPRSTAQVDTVMNTAVNETTAAAWLHYDWSSTSRQACQQCHTATGASNYLSNPATYNNTKNDFQHLDQWTPASKTSNQRELLYCWACHSNAAPGIRRTPGVITADYNYSGVTAAFPDVGDSNICIACHRGMGASGESISSTTALTDATITGGTQGPITGHYLAAAGFMYVKNGFTAFIDPTTTVPGGTYTYGASYTMYYGSGSTPSGQISSTHRKLGTTLINGDSHNPAVFTPGNFDSNGPCVTCHMQAAGQPTRSTSHTLEINANAFNQVCINCHATEGTTTLTGDNFIAVFVDPQGEVFQDALTLAKTILKNNYRITYDNTIYPYFFDDALGAPGFATQVKNWTRTGVAGVTALSASDARKLMGACFNIQILDREPAAFVHARTYVRRLVYDTIDFLDDKTINLSVGATALATTPGTYGKGAAAYTDGTLTTLSPGTTEAMLYLIGWSRTTGGWSSPERP
jgi:mono/diheme cytochrome c family protein